MERQTYQQILDSLKDIDLWLSDLGLRRNADRIRLHIRNVAKLKKAYEDGELKELTQKHGTVELMWSLIEAQEFSDVYGALRDYDPDVLRKKLRHALKGPLDPSRETQKSNIGRNTMFELNIASRLYCKGLPVHLVENPDILCEIGLGKIYIQCKRPFLENRVPRNIAAAKRQLTRDLDSSNDKSTRGVIAISVSRALNPGDRLFVAANEDSMKQLADDIQILADWYSQSWKDIVDTRIIGILFHIIGPAFVEEIGLLVAAQQTDMFSLALPSSSDSYLLGELTALLKQHYTDRVNTLSG